MKTGPAAGMATDPRQSDKGESDTPPTAPSQAPGLICASCGAPGSPPTVCAPATTYYALIPAFIGDGKVELLCGRCRAGRRP